MQENSRSWFVSLSDSEKLLFLAHLSHDLTIHGRYFGLDETNATPEQKIQAFKGLNELQHQISQHIAHLEDGTKRYPDDVLWNILQEKAAAYGLSNHLNGSIEKVIE